MPDTDEPPIPCSHPGGCPCDVCEDERARFSSAEAVLRDADEIA